MKLSLNDQHDFEASDRCEICGLGPDASVHNGTPENPAPEGNHDYEAALAAAEPTREQAIAALAPPPNTQNLSYDAGFSAAKNRVLALFRAEAKLKPTCSKCGAHVMLEGMVCSKACAADGP